MKTIIAGSRDITSMTELREAIRTAPFPVTSVVCGMARGADMLGHRYAQEEKLPVYPFPADWNTYGKRAGYLRNAEMAENAEALIALWDGKSKGTKHMIDIATAKGLKVHVHTLHMS